MPPDLDLAELPDSAPNEIPASRGTRDLDAVYDIPVTVSAVLGKATMQVSQLLKLGSRRSRGTRSQSRGGN